MKYTKRLVGARQHCNVMDEDGDPVKLDDKGQVRVAMALILRQAECDVVHYRNAGFIRNGKVEVPNVGKPKRMQGTNYVDPQDVKETVAMFQTGYFQRWANALELNHRIDTERLMGAGMGTELGRKRTQIEA